jgi:hypothetical protein
LAVALSTTPNSTSANALPARPFPALPRQTPGSRSLRAFYNVPSDASLRADRVMPYPATMRAAVQLIETDSMSVIGPSEVVLRGDEAVGHLLWLQVGCAAKRGGKGGTALTGQSQEHRRPAAE